RRNPPPSTPFPYTTLFRSTIKTGVEVGKDITLEELRAQGYQAFYIAIGCQGGRKTGVPGEDADGVVTAVDFLRRAMELSDQNVVDRKSTRLNSSHVSISYA